jgi:hypothetical protein
MELAENVLQVVLDGMLADDYTRGDFFVLMAAIAATTARVSQAESF